MEKVVEAWMPVIKKCRELKEEQYLPFAQLLENQFRSWTSGDMEGIVDFTRFALPMVRKVLNQLWKEGFEIDVLDRDWGTTDWPVTVMDMSEAIKIANKQLTGMDREAVLTDLLTDQIVEELINDFPDRELTLYLLMVPGDHPLDSPEALKPGKKRIVMRVRA